jgi:hypothetical protein
MSRETLVMPAETPRALLDLTRRCWQWDPSVRPSMAEVLQVRWWLTPLCARPYTPSAHQTLRASTDPITGNPPSMSAGLGARAVGHLHESARGSPSPGALRAPNGVRSVCVRCACACACNLMCVLAVN